MSISGRFLALFPAVVLTAATAHLAGAAARAENAEGREGRERLRAERGQHHARARSSSAIRRAGCAGPATPPGCIFEWRRPGRRRTLDLGCGARRRSAAQAIGRGTPQRAAGRPAVGTRRSAASSSSTAATSSCSTRSPARAGRSRARPGNEANPRWARRESAVTFTRDNNLFLVPLDSGELTQLTDVQPRKRDPRETDSQKFIKTEEQKLIDHTRIEAEKKKRAEEKEKAHELPKLELAERQSADRPAALP